MNKPRAIEEYYLAAKDALQKYEAEKGVYASELVSLTEAEIELDNQRAIVTQYLESTNVSKTALKDMVAGDERVRAAKATLMRMKANKELRGVVLKYLEMQYSLEKKMIGESNKDKQMMGG